jgi:hypothetical protein
LPAATRGVHAVCTPLHPALLLVENQRLILHALLKWAAALCGDPRMSRILLAASALMLVAACAGSSDVVKTGPDTYMIARHGTSGWSLGQNQKAKALRDAAQYCRRQGKQMQAISAVETGAEAYGKMSSAEVDFRCTSERQTK